ncbi:MAG: hypothetical protein R3B13_03530 [Polyangiaceae bacterium]
MSKHIRTAAPALGIDIGRVIISPVDEHGGDTQFLSGSEDDAMRTPQMPGAFAAIGRLRDPFAGRVWIVSKCGPKIEARSRRWLALQGFHQLTGIPPEHLRFCRERRDKAIHARRLALTHFVDDRADVLAHLDGIVRHRFLFGPQRRPAPAWAIPVLDWGATEGHLLSTLGTARAAG